MTTVVMPTVERPRICRISKSRDIRYLRRTGRFVRGENVFAWVSRDGCGRNGKEPGAVPRVGVIAGRGFDGAVPRNRARRRVRGCVMDLRHLLEPGCSYLFLCRHGTEKVDYQILVNEIRTILSRI